MLLVIPRQKDSLPLIQLQRHLVIAGYRLFLRRRRSIRKVDIFIDFSPKKTLQLSAVIANPFTVLGYGYRC